MSISSNEIARIDERIGAAGAYRVGAHVERLPRRMVLREGHSTALRAH
jgi:hypothetical protein